MIGHGQIACPPVGFLFGHTLTLHVMTLYPLGVDSRPVDRVGEDLVQEEASGLPDSFPVLSVLTPGLTERSPFVDAG